MALYISIPKFQVLNEERPSNRFTPSITAIQFRTRKRTIPFEEIVDTGIGYLGKRSNYVGFYYIVLRLKNGEEYPLFVPGHFFDGGSDRTVMESRRQRLEQCMGACRTYRIAAKEWLGEDRF